ncbi:hypothetical protein [Microbacterium sp. K35]|uniref:hypothetical protein n=1 Tax=Microbacterium sp. K35 TaxID=2305440 RepID=UPI00109B7BDE|nr:hypothetical protein [Microbacterium sp. K35]
MMFTATPLPATAASGPEFLGVPLAVLAFGVSLLSFLIALSALGWQVTKHFLDGGRVKVYLNTAILYPEYMIATNRSGKHQLQNKHPAQEVIRNGEALELAQLVVENPGRSAVTIYSPGLKFSRHGKKNHTATPRMFETEGSFGSEAAVTDSVVRLEPYGRVTFLLDYWSIVPGLLKGSPKGRVDIRGHVSVAGRTKRPQRSSYWKRWRIKRGMYTAIEGSPDFTPLAVLWREMYLRLPKDGDEQDAHPSHQTHPTTRYAAVYLLNRAMSCFEERPERDELIEVLHELARADGDKFAYFGLHLLEGYEALDRMEGHLTPWPEGLVTASQSKKSAPQDGSPDSNDPTGESDTVALSTEET